MSKRTVEFDFDIGDPVLIEPIGMIGRIDGLLFDSLGPQYRVIFWNDGSRKAEVMYPWELKKEAGRG